MRSLWRDLREHRVAAVLLLVWWIAVLGFEMYSEVYRWTHSGRSAPVWSDPSSVYISALFFAFPFVAAILAGWWRDTARQSGLSLGPSVLSGLLMGQISCVAWALFIAGFRSLIGPLVTTSDLWRNREGDDFMVVVFFVLGSVIGALGGTVGGLAARASGRAPSESQSVGRRSSR